MHDVKNTLRGVKLGASKGDASSEDLARGYYDAGPEGNYEGSLEPEGFMGGGATRHAGHIEADSEYRPSHGLNDEYGFVRRPLHGGDVERN